MPTRFLLILLAILPSACGGERSTPAVVRSKPTPPVGALEVRVVDRPAADRAVIEARWERGRLGRRAAVELVLPDGAWVVGGPDRRTTMGPKRQGVLTWTVGFRATSPLDATVRIEADTDRGPRAREASVRLTQP